MQQSLKLSELVMQVEEAISNRFAGQVFWITAEITDVKKYTDKRWCFLKFIEKEDSRISTEIKGVFWATSYPAIEKFERLTGQVFSSGIEINCCVRVRFHKRFGLDLEIVDIDCTYTLGKLEIEKQETLNRLLRENPSFIHQADGQYVTFNNQIELPWIVQRIALITAPNSDGQRDFMQELHKNRYGYSFKVKEYLIQIQGENAAGLILKQLEAIENLKDHFDAVAIVRGGGSATDFKPFDDYDVARKIAAFPIPVFTGIGHDRNTSIADMMARQHKTPTKVAAYIVERSYNFESEIQYMKERFFRKADVIVDESKRQLREVKQLLEDELGNFFIDKNTALTAIKRIVKSLSPETILNKGFAMVVVNNKIITSPEEIALHSEIETHLKDYIIKSTVNDKQTNSL